MRTMILADKNAASPFVVERTAFEGVKRVAQKVAADVKAVCGCRPAVQELAEREETEDLCRQDVPGGGNAVKGCGTKDMTDRGREEAAGGGVDNGKADKTDGMFCHAGDCAVFAATVGRSRLLESLEEEGKIDLISIRGKREVFSLCIVEAPFAGVRQALVICGSDKRGTIYGLFQLSELLGVSPLVFWGDAKPVKKEQFLFTPRMQMISKEPSVKYRGFFINDEWPCFGNWTFSHFGGFNAQMYDHVFELLLRLKGNYLWPAMWTSSFPLDGPGNLNEELADTYGIVIGFSHHEPCLRASEEWDKVRGEGTPYGNEWNYHTNAEGLTRYWADGLKRSGRYEHLITIGMRGERDSSMLGEEASLKENIDLLKKIILKQRELIRAYVAEEADGVPQLLALYKEVEEYFYGDEQTEGLKEWEELKNVIFMLCEDNFGHMRTLPDEELRSHSGGFGMYYHLDYHGSPVSYEWMPSTPFSLIWEQMTQAYEYGVREAWIVNVGDLKGNEIALQYFLTLAYDFDTWGSSAPGSFRKYTDRWVESIFPDAKEEMRKDMAEVYTGFVNLNAMRRPETLHQGVYHPCHYLETDRMLALVRRVEEKNERAYAALSGERREAYYSLLYYPAKASINLLRMHLYAGKNAHYAMQGRKAANTYGNLMAECIREDRRLAEEFGSFRDGKWKGMELERHIGFTKWNGDGWKYPVRMQVEPVDFPRMSVSRADEERIALKNYGKPDCIFVQDFLYPGVTQALLEIANDGVGFLEYEITVPSGTLPKWLTVSPQKGRAEELCIVTLLCNRAYLPETEETVRLLISAGETKVSVEVTGRRECFAADDKTKLPAGTFFGKEGVIVMEAGHYCRKKDTEKGSFTFLADYGRHGTGMKVLPATAVFTPEEEKPSLTYRAFVPERGEYRVELWMAPSNSLQNRKPLRVELSAEIVFGSEAAVREQKKQRRIVEILGSSFRGGDWKEAEWCRGVLEQVRICSAVMHMETGLQEITVGALEAGVVLERIVICPAKQQLRESYLGPEESYYL